MDGSTLNLERSTNGEMIACSPDAVSPRGSTAEETNGRDDVDWAGVVLRDLENNGHLRGLKLLKDLDCLELCEIWFAMSITARDNKRWALSAERLVPSAYMRQCWRCHLSITDHMPQAAVTPHPRNCPGQASSVSTKGKSAYCGGFVDRIESLKGLRMSKTVGTRGRGTTCGT